eukprot:s575_g38.t1
MNIKTEAQRRAPEAAQLRERKTFLPFTRKAVLKQHAGENPHPSKAWKQPEIIDAFERLPQAVLDQCEYGLKHPENHMSIQKATRFMGQEEVFTYLHTRCSGDHDHEVIEGNVRVGGRAVKSCQNGVEAIPFLSAKQSSTELSPISRRSRTTEEEEEESEENKEFNEHQMPPEDKQERDIEDLLDAARQHAERHAEMNPPPAAPDHRRFQLAPEVQAVEQAHRQLGHPSRNTLVRMLRLAGATDGAIEHAKVWRCDVCASRAPPKHPTAAAPGLRPYGFNRHHLVDLKYFRDSRRKLYVALSMLGAGTLFHQAVLLAPAKIRLDQGGEFEGGFTALSENYRIIPSTVTATQAGW